MSQTGYPTDLGRAPASGPASVKDAIPQSAPSLQAPPLLAYAPVARAPLIGKLITSAYRVAGFAILTGILGGLAWYLAADLFYFASSAWMEPTVLSATDPHVLQLDAMASQELTARGGVVAQKLALDAQLKAAKRVSSVERAYQQAFHTAMATDLADRSAELARLQSLVEAYGTTKREVQQSSQDFAHMSRGQLDDQYRAHVIDADALLSGNYQLAQIAGANLGLEEKGVEIDGRIADLQRMVQSLRSAQHGAVPGLSYEVLHATRELDQSILAAAKAEDDAEALQKSIAELDSIIASHDRLIETLRRSPYEMAADKSLSMAFVPYDNRSAVAVGTSVYACALTFVWCRRVGSVAEVVDGEVVGKHPVHNKDLRGVMVRLTLDEAKAIEKPVLHLGRKPLFF